MNILKRIVNGNNWMPGRQGHSVDSIIIHTEVGNQDGSEARFNNPSSQVSVHFGVGLDGNIRQWVEEPDTAYQAGNWTVNLNSIGIEHEDNGNYNDAVRTDAQYTASSDLVADICRRYGIPCDRGHILKHSEVIDRSRYPGGTGCCDGLDIERIVREAAAKLNGAPVAAPEAPAPAPTGNVLNLPGTVSSWRIYRPGGPWTVGNEVAVLDPAMYGGLSYVIQGRPAPNFYLIQTQMFGQVVIYAGPDTPASFSDNNPPAPVAPPLAPATEPAPTPVTTGKAIVVTPAAGTSTVGTIVDPTITSTTATYSDFRNTFKEVNGNFKATKDVIVKDVFGNAPDQRLGKGQLVIRGGTFEKDGIPYTRTKKSVQNKIWYAIPSDCLVPTAKPGKYVSKLISDIQSKPAPLYDEVDHVVEDLVHDPGFEQIIQHFDKREQRLATIGHTQDKLAAFFTKLNIFKSNKQKGA